MTRLGKYTCLEGISEITDLIDHFYTLTRHSPLYLGVSGSVLSLQYNGTSDVDFILILPDQWPLERTTIFPSFFDQKYLSMVNDNHYLATIDVVGTNHIRNRKIKVEVYKASIANAIMQDHTFNIRRLKNINKTKQEAFININGSVINRPLSVTGELSKTVSAIKQNGLLYHGMHYERIFLSDTIVDSMDFAKTIQKARLSLIDKNIATTDLRKAFFLTSTNEKVDITNLLEAKL